ncbi:MAG TPA: BamA/TamA family outer membrane protein, partial [Bacteroidia bacterium]|nr:BamA/TamA family outer membrane protein [Bacteroidia bacterium]
GYEEHEANVDRGYVLNAELRTPALSLQKAGEVQFLVFVDHGGGRSVDRLPGEGDVSMTSVGPGLRWTLGENVSLRFDYGFQLEDSGAGLGMGDSRAHIGAVLAW